MITLQPILALFTTTWWQHVGIVAGYTLCGLALILWVRQWCDPIRVRRLEIALGVGALVASLASNWWWLRPANFDVRESLPLHMCDMAGLFVPVALLTKAHWARTLLHFWGFGLCSQWVCTPVAQGGPQTAEFWVSFGLHASILGSAAWDVSIGGYRPRPNWADWRLAVIAGVAYAALMIPLDIAIKANYGYLGDTRPNATTIVDVLGPWPLRIIWILLLGTLAVTLVQAAWIVMDRLKINPLPRSARTSELS